MPSKTLAARIRTTDILNAMLGGVSERAALEALERAGREIVDGVRALLPAWAEESARRLLDAWGRHPTGEREAIALRARRAGEDAATRIGADLETLFALDPDAQPTTPLQIVRTAYVEVAPVLDEAGLPPIVRDEFEERVNPEDRYGLAPRTLADFGDEGLAQAHLMWGAAKARIHITRRR